MRTAAPPWLRQAARLLRLLAVVLAVAGQLGGVAHAAAQDNQAAQLRALDAAMLLCQPGHPPGERHAPPSHGLLQEAAILQAGGAGQLAILAVLPAPPVPDAGCRMRDVALPPARAPPAHYAPAAYPRGPPGLA
jgi:hypothetical protein